MNFGEKNKKQEMFYKGKREVEFEEG